MEQIEVGRIGYGQFWLHRAWIGEVASVICQQLFSSYREQRGMNELDFRFLHVQRGGAKLETSELQTLLVFRFLGVHVSELGL